MYICYRVQIDEKGLKIHLNIYGNMLIHYVHMVIDVNTSYALSIYVYVVHCVYVYIYVYILSFYSRVFCLLLLYKCMHDSCFHKHTHSHPPPHTHPHTNTHTDKHSSHT
eukprot:GHVQ01009816.1.p1 GENE.GHVQ01009816.1~~GHVQ01009816.1.p1  ORF type:complete len:109 (-),score=7.16 GHVQ01009816.1:53-379(-)